MLQKQDASSGQLSEEQRARSFRGQTCFRKGAGHSAPAGTRWLQLTRSSTLAQRWHPCPLAACCAASIGHCWPERCWAHPFSQGINEAAVCTHQRNSLSKAAGLQPQRPVWDTHVTPSPRSLEGTSSLCWSSTVPPKKREQHHAALRWNSGWANKNETDLMTGSENRSLGCCVTDRQTLAWRGWESNSLSPHPLPCCF